ncbi:MAG TPA: ATP-binding protein, partial [Gemmatirosa sp.]
LFARAVAVAHPVGGLAPRGRIAANTTAAVLVLGLALLLLDAPALVGRGARARAGRFVRWACTGAGLLIPYFALVGYLFGVQRLYNPSGMLAGMGLNTAVALTLLAIGIALARPARGVARLLAGDDAGAILLRRALPVVIAVPLAFGWLRVRGEELGYFTARVGVAALVLAVTVVMVTTLTRAGAAAYRVAADRARILAEREAAREALGRSEAEFREMTDNLPQLAWMAGADGTIFWYNRRWYDYTGTTPDQMQNDGWRTIHHPDHRDRVEAGYRAAIAHGTPWEDTFPMRSATGEWCWFLSRANPIWAAGGARALRWFGTHTDVTALRTLEAERERLLAAERQARADAERASAEAERANRAKSQFLATMSHELRTPLNAISGHVQLVELGLHGPVTPEQRDALNRAQRAQRHLLGLINDVLNLARIEAGRVDYRIGEVVIADLAADVASLIAPQLAAKGIGFTVDVPEEHAAVAWTDREKASQVLLNLLSNAIKFTDAGGHVTLEARAEDGPTGPVVTFRVRDTGRGIPVEDRARIFEPFVQLDAGYARQQEGTGLGLAISRDLARGMGGDLTLATSSEDHGSVFALSLPRVLPAGPDVDRRTGEERRDGQRRETLDRRTGEERRDDAPDSLITYDT